MVSNIQNMENLNPQVMRILGKEMQSLKMEPLEGISVILDDQDITQVEAIIDGPVDTPYFGGKFRVKLTIGKDFPQGPPKGFFITKIFHPNVSSKGEIVSSLLLLSPVYTLRFVNVPHTTKKALVCSCIVKLFFSALIP